MDNKYLTEKIIQIIESRIKYLRTYLGKVIEVDDDLKRGRIKCYVLELYWMDGESAVWIDPCYTRSMLKIKKDDYVLIGFKNGDKKRPYYFGISQELEDMMPSEYDGELQVLFQSNNGDLLVTYSDDDKEYILTLKKDDSSSTTITKNKDGIAIEDCNGNKYTNDKDGIIIEDCKDNKYTNNNNGIEIECKNGNIIKMKNTGTVIEDCNSSNKIEMTNTGTKITDKNSNVIEMKAGKIAITGTAIDMLGATQAFLKGNDVVTAFTTWCTVWSSMPVGTLIQDTAVLAAMQGACAALLVSLNLAKSTTIKGA
jgi:hypothetical protein